MIRCMLDTLSVHKYYSRKCCGVWPGGGKWSEWSGKCHEETGRDSTGYSYSKVASTRTTERN